MTRNVTAAHIQANMEVAEQSDDTLLRLEERPRRKIFYLVDSFNIGGTESQAAELAIRMSKRGHRVTLGCLKAQGPLMQLVQTSNVAIREFHPNGGLDSIGGAYQLLRLATHLRKHGYDIVHTHDLWSNLLGIPAARIAGVAAIISSRRDLGHLDWYTSSRRAWLRRIQGVSDVVLANATSIRDALISEDGFTPAKLRVIHNGIEIEKFQCFGDRQKLLPQAGAGKLIVLVGNMHSDVKGHSLLIKSARSVITAFPDAKFVLVGEGELRLRFESEVRALELTDNFIFLGKRDDVPEVLSCCDIAVLPSLAEGLPNAVLEYMAAGLPCVVSSAGGNTELVKDGVTGMVVPPGDSIALAETLKKVLRDSELAYQLARKGREFVERNFSFERMVEQVEELYAELLLNRARTA